MKDENSHNPCVAIERFVKLNRAQFRSADLYIHIARTLYEEWPRADKEVLDILSKHLPSGIVEVPECLLQILRTRKREAIEHCLDCKNHDLLPVGWQYTTPIEISELCAHLINIKEGDKVLMPFFGLSADAWRLKERADVVIEGHEFNPLVWALAQIGLWAHDIDGSKVQLADSFKAIEALEDASQSHILMAPSCGGDDSDDAVRAITLCMRKLREDGRMVVLTPHTLSISSQYAAFRDNMVKHVECVISMPGSLFGSSFPYCIWVMTKAKHEEMLLIDGEKFVVMDIDDELVIRASIRTVIDDGFGRNSLRMHVEKLIGQTLYPPRVMFKSQVADMPMARTLGKLVEVVTPERCLDTTIPAITLGKLADSYFHAEINPADCPAGRSSAMNSVTGPVILLAATKGLTAGVWNKEGIVRIHPKMVALKLTSHDIDQQYLLKMLLSKEVKAQLERMNGLAVSSYRYRVPSLAKDILDISISVPPLAEQHRQLREDAMNEYLRVQDLVDQSRQQELEMLASHRHVLYNKFLALTCDINVIRKLMDKHGQLTRDTVVNPITHRNLGQLLDGLEEKCQMVSSSISMLKDLSEDKCHEINLNEFFTELLKEENYCGLPRTVYQFIENADTPGVAVLFPRKSLVRICENIFGNARKYAFGNSPAPNRDQIRVSWKMVSDSIILDIANNGQALSISPEEVLKAGATTGQTGGGQGGFEIKNRMRLYDGTAEVLSHPDEEWTVTYRLTFNNITN